MRVLCFEGLLTIKLTMTHSTVLILAYLLTELALLEHLMSTGCISVDISGDYVRKHHSEKQFHVDSSAKVAPYSISKE